MRPSRTRDLALHLSDRAPVTINIPHPPDPSVQNENGPSGRFNLDVDIPRRPLVIDRVDRPPFGINSGRGIKFWTCRIVIRRGRKRKGVEAQTSLFKAQRSQLSPLSSLTLESTDYDFV